MFTELVPECRPLVGLPLCHNIVDVGRQGHFSHIVIEEGRIASFKAQLVSEDHYKKLTEVTCCPPEAVHSCKQRARPGLLCSVEASTYTSLSVVGDVRKLLLCLLFPSVCNRAPFREHRSDEDLAGLSALTWRVGYSRDNIDAPMPKIEGTRGWA